jgi:hypothetical protein
MRASDIIKENAYTTFAGKDISSFESPKGGKPAYLLQTEQGSQYLITDDGMVIRNKSVHANTGGDDAGLKDWADVIEYYHPDPVGGVTFPLAVSKAIEKSMKVALSKSKDGERVLAIFKDGEWKAARISDVFKHVASEDAIIKQKYSTTPKLNWHVLDYNLKSDGSLSKVHPGSPVSHGVKL